MTQSISSAIIIGGGPAGLMAAETLAERGVQVDLYDAMPSVGRKFLLAGKGGLNLTHAEPKEAFLARYGEHRKYIEPLLQHFDSQALCEWAHDLGIETFVGTSGRVFPKEMKAAPLLRAWLHRLRAQGVRFHMRHRWIGWASEERATALRFQTSNDQVVAEADAVILALGGASWKRLGSDAAWVPLLALRGIQIAPLKPANCGFEVQWSTHLRERFAGQPLKSVRLSFEGESRIGEMLVSEYGIEGSLTYAFSALLRDAIEAQGEAIIRLDLAPDKSTDALAKEIAHPRGSRSMSSHLSSRLGISGVKAGLLRECLSKEVFDDAKRLAEGIKALPVRLIRPRPIDEAISTAGGVRFDELNENLMLKKLPGVYCCGEMLDWEARTGGYLLTACFASGKAAGQG
ncbi:MAG TPA: TIGR03862 family flavoprotein [Burkholderiales bacterium]|nr:TIGR03862 family flavoprotein [Burkholderiales bacterium]